MEPMKYLANFVEMWYISVVFVMGVVFVLYGIWRTVASKTYTRGIWPTGIGTILTVCSLLLCAGWNDTAYYPSTADLQSSLTIVNSCSSEFTLRTMAIVSIFIPFVLAYIVYAWRAIDRKKIAKWKYLSKKYGGTLVPDRKSGRDLLKYLQEKICFGRNQRRKGA